MPEELVGLDPGEPGLVDHLGVVQALHLRVEEVNTLSILSSIRGVNIFSVHLLVRNFNQNYNHYRVILVVFPFINMSKHVFICYNFMHCVN